MPPRTRRTLQEESLAAAAVSSPSSCVASASTPATESARRSSKRKASTSNAVGSSAAKVKKEERTRPKASSAPRDHLTTLSAELISLILCHLSSPASLDLGSLFRLSLVSKSLLPHVRGHLYRSLTIDTRTNAHAMHRTLHGNNDVNRSVRTITADVGQCAKTSSQWLGWFLFHSMHSLCGIIGSCRTLLHLTIYLPAESSAWTHSLCSSLVDLKLLNTLDKDLIKSSPTIRGAGRTEGMDVGWKTCKSSAMWSVSQFMKPLATLKSLTTLRLCNISSDSSTSPPQQQHSCRLTEVVLIEVNITNTDLLHLLGNAQTLKKLTLWRSSLLSKRGLTHVLKRCPNLVELRIGGSWFGAKDEDDTNFPLDISISHLPNLRLVHCSGALISPAILLSPSTNLTHLLVSACPSFTPQALHMALAKMRSDPPPVARLTLPEMGKGEGWSEEWKFTVRATAEAKGVTLETGPDLDTGSESGGE